jgi:hypothetical protein
MLAIAIEANIFRNIAIMANVVFQEETKKHFPSKTDRQCGVTFVAKCVAFIPPGQR